MVKTVKINCRFSLFLSENPYLSCLRLVSLKIIDIFEIVMGNKRKEAKENNIIYNITVIYYIIFNNILNIL